MNFITSTNKSEVSTAIAAVLTAIAGLVAAIFPQYKDTALRVAEVIAYLFTLYIGQHLVTKVQTIKSAERTAGLMMAENQAKVDGPENGQTQ